MHSFSKKEFLALAGASVLLLPALLLNLHIVPLYVEEPRRAVVALEMLFSHNWLVPTINAVPYYLKPPFFNWILASFYTLTGHSSEFITRLPTVISFFLLGLVIYTAGKRYVSRSFGALSSLLFMTAAGNLFFNSLLAEIDLFYSLVTYTGLICLFHFQRKGKYYQLFLSVYFLGAIGVLTKGAPSLVYTGLSLLVWFLVNRQFRKLFSIPHVLGILVFVLLVGAYFYAYGQQGDAWHYLKSLSVESGRRLSGNTIWDYVRQVAWYPLDTLINLMPASILVIFAFRRSFIQTIRSNPFLKFALIMLAVHFPVYWLSPGGRQRYILMLYPFIIQIISYFYLEFFKEDGRKADFLRVLFILVSGLLAIGSLGVLFVRGLGTAPGLPAIASLSCLAFITILLLQLKYPRSSIISVIFTVILLRIFFDLIVLPIRAGAGKASENKAAAMMLCELTKDGRASVLGSTEFPLQCTYYMERTRREILPTSYELLPGQYYIAEKILLKDYQFRRESATIPENSLKSVYHPSDGDYFDLYQDFDYKIAFDFSLQYTMFLLVTPVHPRP